MRIDESKVQEAFDHLESYADAAKARATRLYLEDYSDHLIGCLMEDYKDHPVGVRKELARGDPKYLEHIKRLAAARERDEWFRGKTRLAEALIEGWRTASANERGMAKVA